MKKVIAFCMVVFMVFTLCACKPKGDEQKDKQDINESSDGRGDVFDDYKIPEGADEIRQGVFYYELYELSGDPGDGLTPREGAGLVDELLASTGLYSGDRISADECLYISFDDLMIIDSAMGRECYIYSVALGTAEGGLMGDGYQVIYRFSVDYSGNKTASIYEDFSDTILDDGLGDVISKDNTHTDNTSKDDGRGDVLSQDDGKGDLIPDGPNWRGMYVGDEFSIEITKFNGSSFWFDIYLLRNGSTVMSGTATLYPDDKYMAEYGEISFSLYKDYSAIDFFAPESSDWAHMRGQYKFIE